MIDCADAREWLQEYVYQADLLLTDPPHLDTFDSLEEHRGFVAVWYPLAFEALRNRNSILIHTCGQNPYELRNYLSARGAGPSMIRIWRHEIGFHFHLVYGNALSLARLAPAVFSDTKPDPLWKDIIRDCVPSDSVVIDPFCGRGEIPLAAKGCGRRYRGCDIDPTSVAYCLGRGL